MRGRPTTFWGKLEQDESKVVIAWHPLLAHCADVAACAQALLEQTLLRRHLAALASREDLDAVDIARLSVLAALHDIGKFNLGFQRKADAERRDTAGHVAEVLALCGSGYEVEKQLMASLPVAALDTWCADGGAFELLVAAVEHHGRPVRCGSADRLDPSLWRVERSLDPFAGIATLTEATRAWFPTAFSSTRSDLPDAPAFQHGFAGLVMLADWLGSDPQAAPLSGRAAVPTGRHAAFSERRAVLPVRPAAFTVSTAGFKAAPAGFKAAPAAFPLRSAAFPMRSTAFLVRRAVLPVRPAAFTVSAARFIPADRHLRRDRHEQAHVVLRHVPLQDPNLLPLSIPGGSAPAPAARPRPAASACGTLSSRRGAGGSRNRVCAVSVGGHRSGSYPNASPSRRPPQC